MLVTATILLLGIISSSTASVGLPGGQRNVSQTELRDSVHQEALKVLLTEYNKKSNAAFHYVLYNVEAATLQIVAGMRLTYTLVLVPSSCRKGLQEPEEEITLTNCLIGQGHAERCQAVHHVQPWLIHGAPHQVISIDCSPVDELELHENVFHTGHDDQKIGNLKEFQFFLSLFNKQYGTVEFQERFKTFQSNMKKAALLSLMEVGSGTYGITPFTDLTEEEFQQKYLSAPWDTSARPSIEAPEVANSSDIPAAFDWRERGAVTPVKNQGQCGSCWAFSTTGNVEGQWFVKRGKLVSLSEQELVDCDKVDHGCNGGLPSNAYKEIIRLGGLMTDKDYAYTGKQSSCKFDSSKAAVFINGSVGISKDENQMAAWLVQNGPISIGINAKVMQFYTGGISHPWSILCNKHELNHGVLIVGYGVSSSKEPYWVVKNSWGTHWGTQGYYYVYRGDGTCGLNTMCTSALVN